MPIEFDVKNGIGTVTINRPEAMNAIDPQMRRDLIEVWHRIRTEDAVSVVMITGAGDRAFCTGNDLKRTMPPKESFAELSLGRGQDDHLVASLITDKPLICAINGYAIGGGLELALACDIRIASQNAEFGLSEVRVGAIPGAGGTQRLPRLIGQTAAMMMLLTGDRIDAEEARRVGLVSEVLPLADLMPRAYAIANRILGNAPLAVRAVKRLVREGQDVPLATAMNVERYMWGILRDTHDRIEGRMAFREKRKPVFQGR